LTSLPARGSVWGSTLSITSNMITTESTLLIDNSLL
jgi:hypothetical protein